MPGTSVKVNKRSQLVSREIQYSVRDARNGSVAKVASWCTDVRPRMSDSVTLCSPVVGVRDRVNGSYREGRKEGRKVCVHVHVCMYVCMHVCVCHSQ